MKGKIPLYLWRDSPPPLGQDSLGGPEGSSWGWTPVLTTWQETLLREQSPFVLKSGLNHNPAGDW